jgi:choline-sulfatase
MPRARPVGVSLLAVTFLACTPEPPAPLSPAEWPAALRQQGPPNIVLVLVDTLRANSTTPYDPTLDTTPELARWAAQGVVFEQALAQSSWTKISMASTFTSLWPATHAIREPTDGLAPEAITLAELLRDAGYATYGVQTNGWLDQSFGFHQGFDRYLFPRGAGAKELTHATVWPHAKRVASEALRLVDAHDRARPFFLYLHFMDVHEYASPPEFKTYGTGERGAYLAAARWVDDAIARVRQKLEDEGLLERTLLVLASDHGETFGEHGVHGHARNVLTPVLQVPLVLRMPFPVAPLRVSAQVRNLDLAPTILDLAGIAAPPSFQGSSLVPLLSNPAPASRTSYAGLGSPLYLDAEVQVSVSDGHWTFARNLPKPDVENETGAATPTPPSPPVPGPDAGPPEFLFDRSVDPGENVNLVEIEPRQSALMRERLDRHLEVERPGVRETDVRIDPSIAERLRAMGYLH